MRSSPSIVLAALVVLCDLGPVQSRSTTTYPFTGVAYIDRIETLPRPQHMHVAQIDLSAPGLRFRLSPPGGTHEVVRQWNALNLDGGGSTSLAMEDPETHIASLVNASSDNPAGSSLAVWAR